MKRLCISLLAGVAVVAISGCAPVVTVSSTLPVRAVKPSVYTIPIEADLRVEPQRVVGTASGKKSEILTQGRNLTEEAIANALGHSVRVNADSVRLSPSVSKGDALVGVVYTEVKKGKMITMTVTGYPAHYTNFRSITLPDTVSAASDTATVILKVRASSENTVAAVEVETATAATPTPAANTPAPAVNSGAADAPKTDTPNQ